MRARITATLSRHRIGLLVAFLAAAFLVWLMIWYTNRPNVRVDIDCMVKGANGNWHLGPCG